MRVLALLWPGRQHRLQVYLSPRRTISFVLRGVRFNANVKLGGNLKDDQLCMEMEYRTRADKTG